MGDLFTYYKLIEELVDLDFNEITELRPRTYCTKSTNQHMPRCQLKTSDCSNLSGSYSWCLFASSVPLQKLRGRDGFSEH